MRQLPTPTAHPVSKPRPRVSAALEAAVRLGTLVFWAPMLAFDANRLAIGGWTPDACVQVFWTLYGESIVFLAVWAFMASIQALVLVRSGQAPRPAPKRSPRSDSEILRLR